MANVSRKKKATRAFLILVGGMTLLRALLNATMPLSGEEAYYWSWSQQLDLCYFDHPPMIAYIIRLTTTVFGDTPFGVRFGALVLHLGATWLVVSTTFRVYKDQLTALWAGALYTAAVIFAGMGSLMIPDAPLYFFWALALRLIVEAMRPGGEKYWLAVGAAFGLCALSKFHSVLLAVTTGLFLILAPQQRRAFRSRWVYMGCLIAALGIVPILWWNAKNGWPTFGFQLSSRHEFILGRPEYFLEMLITPLGYLGLVTYPLCLASVLWGWRKWRHEGRDELLFMTLACFVPVVFFLFLSVFIKIDSHWAAPGYVSACVLGAGLGMQYRKRHDARPWQKRLLPASVGSGLFVILALYGVLSAMVLFPEILPDGHVKYFKHRRKIRISKLDRFYGWEEIGNRIGQEIDRLGGSDKAFVLCYSGYGTASAIRFYTPGHPDVFTFDYAPQEALQFYLWRQEVDWGGKTALVVLPVRKREKLLRIRRHFDSLEEIEALEITRGGRMRQRFQLFHGQGYRLWPTMP